jgi:hypothetical protein
MKKDKIERYIEIIREMMVVGNTGFQSVGDQTKAGLDPIVKNNVKRRYFKGKRKPWLDFLKQTTNGRGS